MIEDPNSDKDFILPSDQTPKKEGAMLGSAAPDDGEFTPAGEAGDDPITRNLKRAYSEVALEPIPDRLRRLLEQLESEDSQDEDGK